MKLKHIAAVTGAVLVSALFLSGCGSSQPANNQTGDDSKATTTSSDADLVIWADQKRADALKDVAKKFGEDNGITVSVQAVATSLDTSFITADAAGNGPDIVVQGDDKIAAFVQNGSIMPVQLSQSAQDALVPDYLKAVTYQNQVYGVPYAAEGLVLIRNKALAPDAPATFDDLIATGQKAVADGKADLPLALQVGDTGDAFHMQPLYASFGGYLLGTDADGNVDVSDVGLDKDGAMAFAQELSKLGETGSKVLSRSVNADNSVTLFAQGKIPYLISGSWAMSTIQQAGIDYEVSEIPGFAGQQPALPFMSVQAFFVAAHGKNAALAQEFVNNVVPTEETQEALFNAEARPPAIKSLLDKESAKSNDIKVLAEAASEGVVRPKIPQMNTVWDALGKAESAIVGGADPTASMQDAAATVEKALQE
jgi:arabinogalactan oligomer/maltooligosaccharide transport system substrate-binding protein